jgi:two-component system response regulator
VAKRTAVTQRRPPAVILLVEDDLGDQILTQEAFQSIRVPYELRIVCDGKEALDYLYHRESYTAPEQAPRPDLILLDLNMPRVNGQQVAQQIRSDPALRDIPIVVLTTSRREEDILRAYGRGVTSFITKPLEFQRFLEAVRELEDLLRFLVGLKNLRERSHLTSRQMLRLLRRQQKLERLTETLFERHMNQIRGLFGASAAAAVPQDAGDSSTVDLVQKILDRIPHERLKAARKAGRLPAATLGAGTPGLAKLARAIEAASAPDHQTSALSTAARQRPPRGEG